ncbi:MAG: aldehyde dehydrogenase [Actinobacteria bacterium]|nr:aldehyde dehydrogenase [Actinomycetota bacterium]
MNENHLHDVETVGKDGAGLSLWHERAAALVLPAGAFIGGAPIEAASGATLAVVNPATELPLGPVAACDAVDVDAAVASARAAFEAGSWSRRAPAERKRVLLRLAALIGAHGEELALMDSLDMGKPVARAATLDVPGAAEVFAWFAEAADKVYGEVAPTGPEDLAFVTREPLGVVGAVVPWNFPLGMAAWKLAPALVAGNSVVLKPSEESPHSALRLAALAVEAGLPAGVLNVVPGTGEVAGAALGRHPGVDCIAFTGSTAVGRRFLGYAAESAIRPVWLECGGKSPIVVFADVDDLDLTARMVCDGIFTNQGEVCSATSRLLVERSIAGELVERVARLAREVRPGDPLDPDTTFGSLVSEEHTRRVLEFIADGRAGARLLTGGERLPGPGCFVEPTVFEAVEPEMRIWREEIFGPVLAVTPFDDEEEALRLANDTPYGLAASLWTSRLDRATRVGRQLRCGTVSINAVDALSPYTPFGGFGQSGIGRDLSLHALDKFTGLKTTWIRRQA